jgi:hypothetical protein
MPFFLDGNPTQSEVSEAVNYLLSNFTQNVSADPATGQITGPTGEGVGYLYKYIDVKYSDSFDGTLNFSDSPTNRAYYGLRNDDSSTESTNPADYSWYKVTGGFGTTKLLYYLTTGGRQIQFAVATAVPNSGWIQDSGAAIDLDITTKTNAVANFVVIRVANSSAAPTDSECISAIGRTPISGDICTVNYNAGIYSLTFKYTTGWAIFQKYITGDLIVANSIVAANIAAATITATQIASNTITAGNMNVAQLSAITANMGSITAGDLSIGSSPAISGTTMTGTGSHLYNDGRFITGNSTKNMVFNGSTLTLNGIGSATFGGLNSSVQMPLTPSGTAPTGYVDSFVITKPGYVQISVTGEVDFMSNTTIYPGVYAPVTISLRDITGGSLPGSATGVIDTFQIRMGSAVFLPAFGAATSRLYLPLSWTRITNLPVGTYAIFACSDAGFFDAAGNLGYAVPVTDRLFTGRIDVYQPTV